MEVYGEKPKRFTHEWWDYIWYYYKWHIISTVVAVVMVTVGLVQCANKTEYDLRITVVTEKEIVTTHTDAITEFAQGVISDATGNGKNEVLVTGLCLNGKNAEYEQAQLSKLTIELTVPESYIYIMPRNIANEAINNGILEETRTWAGDMESDGYVISLKGNEKLKSFAIDSDGEELYIGVARIFTENDPELEKKRQENGIKVARELVGLE